MKNVKKFSILLTIFFLVGLFFISTPVKAVDFKWVPCQSEYSDKTWVCRNTGGTMSGWNCSLTSEEYNTIDECEVSVNKKNPTPPSATPTPVPETDSTPKPPVTPAQETQIPPVELPAGEKIRCICEDPQGKSACIYGLSPKVWTMDLESDCSSKVDKNHLNCKIETGDCSEYNNQPGLDSLKNKARNTLNPVGFATGQKGMIQFMGTAIAFFMFPIGALAMLMYIWAGFLWMSGSPDSITKAKSILMWTTLGIAASLSSYIFVKYIFTNIFG